MSTHIRSSILNSPQHGRPKRENGRNKGSEGSDGSVGYNKNRGSYMSAHVLLNLLNELGKRDKMRGLPSILSLFRNEFNKIQ